MSLSAAAAAELVVSEVVDWAMTIDWLDLNRRGDENFDSLSDVEKDLYCLLLFQNLYEMEGITHFFLHRFGLVARVLRFLEAVDAPNLNPVQRIAELLTRSATAWDPDGAHGFNLSSEDHAKLNLWENEYYSQVDAMWESVRKYVRVMHNVEVPS